VTTYWTTLGRFPRCHVLWFRSCYGEVCNVLALCEDGHFDAFSSDSSGEASDSDGGCANEEHRAQGRWKVVPEASDSVALCECGLPGSRCVEPLQLTLDLEYVRYARTLCTKRYWRCKGWKACHDWPRGEIGLAKAAGGLGITSPVRVTGSTPCANGPSLCSRWVYCTSLSHGN